MKILVCILFLALAMNVDSQTIKELTPDLFPEIDLTAKGRDSIKKAAALYVTAMKKLNSNMPLSKRENELMTSLEFEDDPSLEIFNERGCYYYIGPGYGCNYYENGGADSVWTSSTLGKNYSADMIYDASLDFAWVEGEKDSGIGQFIYFKMLSNAWPLEKIIIHNGYQKDIQVWKKNNRVKQLMLYVDEKPVAKLNLENVTNGQAFDVSEWFKQREKSYFIKLEILKIYKGSKYNDTAISEISFDGPVSH